MRTNMNMNLLAVLAAAFASPTLALRAADVQQNPDVAVAVIVNVADSADAGILAHFLSTSVFYRLRLMSRRF